MLTIENINQGTKFLANKTIYMKLPTNVECWGRVCNAINVLTGSMTYIDNSVEIIVANDPNDITKNNIKMMINRFQYIEDRVKKFIVYIKKIDIEDINYAAIDPESETIIASIGNNEEVISYNIDDFLVWYNEVGRTIE